MNFRSRQFLDLCYEFDCLLQIPGVCEGGTGEPCHANWAWAGKGGALKAHDCFVVPGCRACHMALDQGRWMSGEVREGYWLRAYGKFLPGLFERGLIGVNRATSAAITEIKPVEYLIPPARERKRKSRCTRSTKTVERPKGGFAA